jgi:hypothetical protein
MLNLQEMSVMAALVSVDTPTRSVVAHTAAHLLGDAERFDHMVAMTVIDQLKVRGLLVINTSEMSISEAGRRAYRATREELARFTSRIPHI